MESVPLHDADPAAEPLLFRKCLGQFATGVTVVTAKVGEELVGLTVNSFSSVSLTPPLILWSIAETSNSYAKFCVADRFTINVLADDQIWLSKHFGRSGPNKFASLSWTMGRNGTPVLNGVAAFFECSRESELRGGDHLILVGRVQRAVQFDRNTLLFAQGRYRIASDHPGENIAMAAT
ncbi:flavin reductase family protein [Bradyrhizobium sp. NP1]|uniref:flavin reductase family protein n=1 Tax=Bradyrhizobium sp. NP1 TaxID=3049772 RepID=UPI0025A4F746|nr:flavin reductase family protein [Bradyrhizobium sp. NP1]WJR77857.1 flavin reductase family protein [Bradyrhizobium sp. NP1]